MHENADELETFRNLISEQCFANFKEESQNVVSQHVWCHLVTINQCPSGNILEILLSHRCTWECGNSTLSGHLLRILRMATDNSAKLLIFLLVIPLGDLCFDFSVWMSHLWDVKDYSTVPNLLPPSFKKKLTVFQLLFGRRKIIKSTFLLAPFAK